MLLCSSKIPVSDLCTPDVFVKLAIDWVMGSRHYEFEPFSWNGSAELMCRGKNGEIFQI